MCRGFQQNERDRLKIKAFYVQLSVSCTKNKTNLPDSLTLHYLPRINGTQLEINGSNIRPDSSSFLTLHRVLSNEISSSKRVVYGCREKVVACEGVRFEVYVNDIKVLKGSYRKEEEGEKWEMGCKCDEVLDGVQDAEVSLAVEGSVDEVAEKVAMVVTRRRKNRCFELEEIPEEREEGLGDECCCCSECGGHEEEEEEEEEVAVMEGGDEELEMEGVRWAVDVGIWVVCLGVGYLVSRSSTSKRLTRKVFV